MGAAGTFDAVGSTELQNAGKAGLIQIQGKISAVLGTVLICKYSFSFLHFHVIPRVLCSFLNDSLLVP